MKAAAKKTLTLVLAMVVIITLMVTCAVIGRNKSMNTTDSPSMTITSLSDLYDDDTRAEEMLATLKESGLVDENGQMVDIDVRHNGESVDLMSIALQIANGGATGDLSVNGVSVTPEQVIKLEVMREELALAGMLSEEVVITEEHIVKLNSLLNSIAGGNTEFSEDTMVAIQSLRSSPLLQSTYSDTAKPATASSVTGDLMISGDKFIAPYINDGTYSANYGFDFANSENQTFYTDDRYDGETTSALAEKPVVTVTMGDSFATPSTSTSGTITFTLSSATDVPVSLDYHIGGVITNDPKGTVKWAAGESGNKTVNVSINTPNFNGQAFAVLNCSNIKNATFEDGKTSFSESFSIAKSDSARGRYGDHQYDATVYTKGNTTLSTRWRTRASYGTDYAHNITGSSSNPLINKPEYIYEGTVDWFSTDGSVFGVTVDINEANGVVASNVIAVIVEFYSPSVAASNRDKALYLTRYDYIYYQNSTWSSKAGRFYFSNSRGLDDPIYFANYFTADMKVGFRVRIITNDQSVTPTLKEVAVRYFEIPSSVKATVSVASGEYTVGEVIPVNVNFDYPVVADKNTKIKINGTWYNLPSIGDGKLDSKTLSVGYEVKANAPSTFSVSEVSGLKNFNGNSISVTEYNDTTVGPQSGVLISSGRKMNTIDFSNAKYGVNDGFPSQTFTAVIPIKSGSDTQWITAEAIDCTESGQGIDMVLPTYGAVELKYYLRGAYFSYDEGMTRYPVYVVTSGSGETPVALVTKYLVPQNVAAYVRRDTVTLYMPDYVVDESITYFPEWSDFLTDDGGYRYFLCGADTTGDGSTFSFTLTSGYAVAPDVDDAVYQYYIKDVVCFAPDAYVMRSQTYEEASEGFIRLEDGQYVLLQDPEHPEYQYDIEFLFSESLYQAVTKGYLREEGNGYYLSYQFSDRAAFSFAEPSYFEWENSDTSKVQIVRASGSDQVELTILGATNNTISIGFRVLNGAKAGESNYRTYEMDCTRFAIAEGKEPYLSIPSLSQNRTTLTNTATDVFFSSNVTVRNAISGHKTTEFTLSLYRLEAECAPIPEEEPIWTGSQSGTSANPAGHVTIPAEALAEKGFYAAVISVTYLGGEAGSSASQTVLSATAYLTVKQGPAKVTLGKLDRYATMDDDVPTITYSVSSETATVMYTIQKSGEAVSEKQLAEDGVVPFAPAAPSGLKDVYVITVYARNDVEDAWSVDSLSMTVYNHDALDIIIKDVATGEIGGTTGGTGTVADGTTVTMSNAERVLEYLNETGYQLTIGDFNAMRTDISLQKIVSANYDSGLWGALSDKMQWSSSDPDALGINYAEGGYYADINVYSYTSYSPYSDFLIVGKEDADSVTVTATHAATGMQASFDVKVETLKDKLYLFQFYPKTQTTVYYVNNNNDKRVVLTDAEGRLAVYEPEGIRGSVAGYSNVDGEVYVGTFMKGDLLSGEADVATLQLYPCNNIRLRSVSGVQLTLIGSDNKPYNGQVILRGGVYKNNIYCPEARIRIDKNDSLGYDGREDIEATVIDGKLTLWFDAMQFRNDTYPEEFRVGDSLSYVFEYRFAETYQPGYVILHTVRDENGGARATDSLIQLKELRGMPNAPQITAQTLQQYYGENHTPNGYTRNVVDFNENIGISKEFNMARLYTDIALLGETLDVDENGNRVYAGTNILKFAIYKPNGQILQGQTESKTTADRIFDLTDLDDTEFFIFPFSAVPFMRSTYLMTAETLSASGITGYKRTATGLKATFVRGETIVRTETLPFGVANLSDLPDPKTESSNIAQEIKGNLEQSLNLGDAFSDVNTDEFVRNGLVFLGGMQTGGSKYSPHLVILPTANPEVFRIIAFIGYNKRDDDSGDGFSVNYDPDQLSEDFDKFKKTLDEMGKDKDDNKDNSGEGSLDFNFYGAIQLQTQWNPDKNNWDISFTGGNVGGNIEGKYEWSYQTMCGPYPFLFTLELGFHVDAELAFANKDGARAILLDAAFGISIDAFAGLGFDLSLVDFQLGVFGMIKADYNFLWLSDGNMTGSKLSIKGEIGIRMKVKLLFISYSQTFCSIPFNIVTKKYGQYDSILQQWETLGYAELSGQTRLGRNYTLLAFPDGTALAAIDGGAALESRDYLDLNERFWYGGGSLRKGGNAATNVQENAYPYSNPVLTEDGGMFLYLSDNGISSSVQSSVSYAVSNGNGYDDKGKIDLDDEFAADSGLAVSGYGEHVFATWIRQVESPEKEAKAGVTNDDLGMMLNASEIYGALYDGTTWSTTRLTDNNNADLSPVVASHGDRAIVAWRSLDASTMPKDNVTDLSSLFDVENNVSYRVYANGLWSNVTIAYNGMAGTVNALDAAILADGTSIITYTVRTGEDETSTETFYTLINAEGDPLTTGRLTNDGFSDVNARAVAIDDGFVVGWYSEHDADIASDQTVKAHDYKLAHIYANGSVDASFIESVGGDVHSSYTSDFRFSSPAGNVDPDKISIVWSHKVDGDNVEDDGKYEISAMRFYESSGAVGLTAPMTIVQTDKNFTIDYFDCYTAADGKVYTVFVGNDYSNVENVEYFDTIDFANTHNYSTSTATKILTVEPVCYIKLASAYYANGAIEATVQTNLAELIPGLDLPVQFSVTNVGTDTIQKITLVGGGLDETFAGLNLLPGQSTTFGITYSVPESNIRDVVFTLTPEDGAAVETTLVLNRPDVGISSMKVVREGDMKRDIQLILTNISGVPLTGSDKTVKLAFYQDASRQYKIGDEITIDPSLYADIDQGVATYAKTFKLSELMNASSNATRVYAYVWVEDSQELYPYDNTQSVMIKRLSLKSGGETFTIDQAIQDNGDGSYTVHIDLRNNTANTQNILYTVNLYGEDGSLVGKKRLSDQALTLTGEETRSLTVTFAQEELSATPVSVDYSKVSIVWLQYEGLEYVAADFIYQADGKYYMVTDESGKLTAIPSAICSYNANYHLNGWYTEMNGKGEFVTTDTVFTSDTTIYANATFHFHKYTYKVVGNSIVATCSEDGHNSKAPNTITLQAPTLKHEGSEGNANAVIIGRIDEVETPAIVYKQGNTVLSSAPTTRGNYTVSITVGGKTLSIAYTITAPLASVVEAPEAGVFVEDGTVKELLTQGVAQNGAMRYALGTDGKTVPTDWSDQVPTASQAGRYYVWYKVSALNSDYVDSYPVGLTAYIYSSNEDSIKYVSYDQVDGNVVKEIKEAPSGYVTLSQDNALTNWNNNWYVVKEDLTLNGNVNVNGNVGLLLCDGATLIINGKLTVNNNANFDVYAQAAEAGALTVLGSTDRGAVVLGEFRIRGGMISIAGKEYYKYTAEELAALQEEDPTVQNEKYNQLALEVGRSNKGENDLSPNGAFHYNSLFAVYHGEVTVTDTQLNDNGEFRPFGGEIDLGALTLKGRESRVIAFGGVVKADKVTVGGFHCTFSVYGGDFSVVNELSSTSYDGGYNVGWLYLNVYGGVMTVNNGINLENNFYQNIVNVYGGTLNVSSGWQAIHGAYDHKIRLNVYGGTLNAIGGERAVQYCDVNVLSGTARFESTSRALDGEYLVSKTARYYNGSEQFPENKTSNLVSDLDWLRYNANRYLTVIGAGTAVGVEYVGFDSPIDSRGIVKKTYDYTEINGNNKPTEWYGYGWYVVTEDVVYDQTVFVNGDVHLILADGVTLTAKKGIRLNSGDGWSTPDASLSIYGQQECTGAIKARGADGCAAIGYSCSSDNYAYTRYEFGKALYVHGGRLDLEGESSNEDDCTAAIVAQTVMIYDGLVATRNGQYTVGTVQVYANRNDSSQVPVLALGKGVKLYYDYWTINYGSPQPHSSIGEIAFRAVVSFKGVSVHMHAFTYEIIDGTFVATCQLEGCNLPDNKHYWTPTMESRDYTGEPYAFSTEGWLGGGLKIIYCISRTEGTADYIDYVGGGYPGQPPVNAGYYYVEVGIKDTWLDNVVLPFTIRPHALSIEWSSDNFVYDGNVHCPTATVSGLFGEDTVELTVEGGQTNAGTHTAIAHIANVGSNYSLPQDNSFEYVIAPKPVTATIVPKTSVYGDKQVALEATTEDGAIVNGDEGVYSLSCTVNELSAVGSYDIVGSDLSDNYAITFVGGEGAYTVTKKALTVTANAHSIAYGDVPSNADVSFDGFVNNEDRTILGGELVFAYTYEQFGHVSDADHAYIITPSGYTSENYAITFNTGVLTVSPKEIVVTIVPKSSIYGEAQVTLEATTEEGAVVNGDTGLYSLTCGVTQLSDVGSYDIVGTDLSENYAITFVDEENAYTVTKKALTVMANPHTITYGDAPANADVSFDGFVNNEDRTVLGGELAFDYSYVQFGHVSDADHAYTITPSGYTSENYAITFNTGVLTVSPKEIVVTIVPKSSIYGEAQVTLDATTEEGAIVGEDTDEDVYGLTCEVSETSNVGSYDIVAAPNSTNYVITFVGMKNSYIVTQKALTVTANPHTVIYGDAPANADVSFDGFVNNEDRTVLGGELAFAYTYEQFGHVSDADHAYTITPSGYTADNYAITFADGVLTVERKVLTVTANPKTITYGDAPANDDVSFDGFVNNEDRNILGGELAFDYSYVQFGHVSDTDHTYTITPSGYTADNYAITFADGVLTVERKALTVTANPKTITYGDAPANDDVSFDGFVNNEDRTVLGGELVFVYTYEQFGHVSDADHAYIITPSGYTSENYAITFNTGVLTVSPKEIVVTIVPKSSIYGEAQVTLEATTEEGAVVNGDTGLYSLTCGVTQLSDVGSYDIVGTDLSENYAITFVDEENAYTVTKKALTVMANPYTITYGDAPANADVSFDGFVNNEDRNILGGELAFDYSYVQFGHVSDADHAYTITPSGYTSGNYDITFETGVLTVVPKALTVTANPHTVIYGDMPANADVSFDGFVNNENRNILGGELAFDYSYVQFGHVSDAEHVYYITPSGYTSENYDITFADGVLTVEPKEITVTIVPKTSVYIETQVALEATTEEGAIVNNDIDVFRLACEVSETSDVGSYDIVGADLSDNYAITFVGEQNAYVVTKRPITATALDETIKYDENLPIFRFELSETIADSVLAELKGKTAFVCDGDPLIPGKYPIEIVFVDDYTSQTVLQNYTVTLESADLYILAKTLKGETELNVEVLLEDTDDAFDYGISVEIESVDVESQESGLDLEVIKKEYVDRRSEISKVYSIKLYRTVVVDGESTVEELQPSDIREDMSVIVKIEIPDYLDGRNFRLLHIHSADDIEYIDEADIEIKDGYVYVKVNRFSDFAFVHLKDNEEMDHVSFCLGWMLFILACLLLAFLGVFFFYFKRKKPLDLAGLIAAAVVLAYAIIAISLHLCVITIVSFVLAALLFSAWLALYLIGKKAKLNASDDDKSGEHIVVSSAQGAVETSSEEVSATDEEASSDEIEEDGGIVVDAKGNYFNIRYNKSFTAKLIQSSDETKGYYGELKNEVLSYKKTKSRISWAYESVNAGRTPVVKFGIRGKTLCVYLPLNADDYADSKYKVEKVESKKYEAVPCLYRIKNDRRLRYAKELIEKVCDSLGLTEGKDMEDNYYLPYESTEALIAKGLIKELTAAATATQIERAKAEGTIRHVDHVSASEVNALISNEVAASAIIVESRGAKATGKKGIINVNTLSANFETGETVTIERLKEKKLIPASVGQVKLLARGKLDKVLHVELQDYSIEAVKMVIATGGTVKKV